MAGTDGSGGQELVTYFVGQVVGSLNTVKPTRRVVLEMVEEFIDAVAMGQITPGPILVSAAFIGLKVAGLAGAAVTTVAMCGPSCMLAFLVTRLWDRFKHARWRIAIQAGLVPVSLGLIAASASVLARSADHTVANAFAECFVESSPAGIMCGKNDESFTSKINEGFEFYKKIGSKAMDIISKEVTLLDDFHAMAKIYWRYSYEKDEKKGSIDFNAFYLVNTVEDQPRIFAYIAGDEQKALKNSGLVQETEDVHS